MQGRGFCFCFLLLLPGCQWHRYEEFQWSCAPVECPEWTDSVRSQSQLSDHLTIVHLTMNIAHRRLRVSLMDSPKSTSELFIHACLHHRWLFSMALSMQSAAGSQVLSVPRASQAQGHPTWRTVLQSSRRQPHRLQQSPNPSFGEAPYSKFVSSLGTLTQPLGILQSSFYTFIYVNPLL